MYVHLSIPPSSILVLACVQSTYLAFTLPYLSPKSRLLLIPPPAAAATQTDVKSQLPEGISAILFLTFHLLFDPLPVKPLGICANHMHE